MPVPAVIQPPLLLAMSRAHTCGHMLAVKGKETRLLGEYFGHRNLQNTALYTDGVSARFRGIWD